MKTKKIRADQLHGPIDEGEVTRKGTKILMDGKPCRVVSVRTDNMTGFVRITHAWITGTNELMSGGGTGEYGAGQLFDEIVED